MAAPKDIAEWMAEKLRRDHTLYQQEVISYLIDNASDEFMHTNENGNLAIDRRVLTEFRKLTEDIAIWERGERMWRIREEHDTPGRRQAD